MHSSPTVPPWIRTGRFSVIARQLDTDKWLTDALKALQIIWEGQDGYFELASTVKQRHHFESASKALAVFANYRYFGPLARTTKGSRGSDVASVGNVLWVDIDSLDAPERISAILAPLAIEPTILIRSGNKGYWAYFKLSHSIGTSDVEELNRRLASLLSADRSWTRSKIARLPGTINEFSGKPATVESIAQHRHDPAVLFQSLHQPSPEKDAANQHAERVQPRLAVIGRPGPLRLNKRLMDYIAAQPKKGQGIDRSRVEQAIFVALAGQGYSEDEIVQAADEWALSKHMEERSKRRDASWTRQSAKKAIEHATDTFKRDMCKEECTKQKIHVDLRDVLPLVNGQKKSSLLNEIVAKFGCSRSAARDHLRRLEGGGYVEQRGERNRATIHLVSDVKGRPGSSRLRRVGLRVPTVKSARDGKRDKMRLI